MKNVRIETERFILRTLKITDVNENYLSWFIDKTTSRYIVSSTEMKSLEKLREYVLLKSESKNVIFLGIFDKFKNKHIGNIKFEIFDIEKGHSDLGILIGDLEYRGKKVGEEVINGCIIYLKEYGVQKIFLGVEIDNLPAVSLYKKLNFILDMDNTLGQNLELSYPMVRYL